MFEASRIDPYARGWFQAAYSDDLAREQARPLRAFGRDFVLWRDALGDVHMMTAYCRHLGAHLGHGGKVRGCAIQCPFHGWCYDSEGQCIEIPYSPNSNLQHRTLETLPVQEVNGLILAWWDPEKTTPDHAFPRLPEYQDKQWSRYYRHSWRVGTVWHEIQENIVDSPHFHYLHGVESLAVVARCEDLGYVLDVDIRHQFRTPSGVQPGFIQTTLYGPYLATVRFRIGDLAEILFIDAITVRDAGQLDLTFSLMARLDGVEIPDMSLELINEAIRQVSEDVPIWENKTHWARPSLTRDDGPIMKFRRWAERFSASELAPRRHKEVASV